MDVSARNRLPGIITDVRIEGLVAQIELKVGDNHVVALITAPWMAAQSGSKGSEEAERVRAASVVFGEVMAASDSAIPQSILKRAEGLAIFPSTIKAGFIVGGMRGRGLAVAHSGSGWSSPAFMTLTGGSFGAQIGGQAADLILVFMNRRGLESLVNNQFKIGADASAAAGPVGRDAQASTDVQLRAEILSYSRARGLFAGITVNGSTVRQDVDANERFYGSRLTSRDLMFGGKGGSPDPISVLRTALERYSK